MDRQVTLRTRPLRQVGRDDRTIALRLLADRRDEFGAQLLRTHRGGSVANQRGRPGLRSAKDGLGRTHGGGYEIQRGRLEPQRRRFGQVTSRARQHRRYPAPRHEPRPHFGASPPHLTTEGCQSRSLNRSRRRSVDRDCSPSVSAAPDFRSLRCCQISQSTTARIRRPDHAMRAIGGAPSEP